MLAAVHPHHHVCGVPLIDAEQEVDHACDFDGLEPALLGMRKTAPLCGGDAVGVALAVHTGVEHHRGSDADELLSREPDPPGFHITVQCRLGSGIGGVERPCEGSFRADYTDARFRIDIKKALALADDAHRIRREDLGDLGVGLLAYTLLDLEAGAEEVLLSVRHLVAARNRNDLVQLRERLSDGRAGTSRVDHASTRLRGFTNSSGFHRLTTLRENLCSWWPSSHDVRTCVLLTSTTSMTGPVNEMKMHSSPTPSGGSSGGMPSASATRAPAMSHGLGNVRFGLVLRRYSLVGSLLSSR